jgi:cyclopropane-fatty-acyl-phospholipid synthase
MNPLAQTVVSHLIKQGNLTVTDPTGHTSTFGDGSGQPVHVVVKSGHAMRAIALNPMLAFPEAYMDGEVEIVEGSLLRLLEIVYRSLETGETALERSLDRLRFFMRRFHQMNNHARAKENVHRHYDLSGEMYKLFLDKDMQYSCAYFERPDFTLEEAQLAKKRHIASKLALKPGHHVLDIGCGWGGMGLYLAKQFQAEVLGITLSTEQHAVATQRAEDEHLQDRVHFEIKDYRDLSERFDRIVSVGMFEHVGVNHYRTFFDKAATLLKPDGVMLLHTIGRSGPPAATNGFIRKYIFPGGHIPALSEMTAAIERSHLAVTDVEVLRIHYAETLKHWRDRFMKNRKRAVELYDERFARMWEMYLVGSEASFRYSDLVVFQVQITKRNDVLPITRDYISRKESSLRTMRDQRVS